MAPGFICSGATSPGITSSSPVEKSATLGSLATIRRCAPTLAAIPKAAGVSRVPAANTVAPCVTSSPARRIHWPTVSAELTRMRDAPSAATATSQSSCMTTVSAPNGMGAPVNMRAALLSCRGWPLPPAAMRCNTGNQVFSAVRSAWRNA